MEEKKLIEFRNIVKSFDSQVVLKGINLDIYENEFVPCLDQVDVVRLHCSESLEDFWMQMKER